jgi:hypothetical protein
MILKIKGFRKNSQELKIELAQSAKIILKQSDEIEALKRNMKHSCQPITRQ